MVIEGNNVSVALRMGEVDGVVRVIIAIHEDDEETAWVAVHSEVAAKVAMALAARATEARQLELEIEAIPLDDRPEKLQKIWNRLNAQQN